MAVRSGYWNKGM